MRPHAYAHVESEAAYQNTNCAEQAAQSRIQQPMLDQSLSPTVKLNLRWGLPALVSALTDVPDWQCMPTEQFAEGASLPHRSQAGAMRRLTTARS